MATKTEITQTVRDVEYAATSATGDAIIRIHNYYGETTAVATVATEADDSPCPYRGLYHFTPDDARYFFGREIFTTRLVQVTQKRNFMAVVGSSGSGKSSVVLAGLVPKLEQQAPGQWKFTHFRPGADPFYALATALLAPDQPDLDQEALRRQKAGELADQLHEGKVSLNSMVAEIQKNYPGQRMLLIADQFEELYTVCHDPERRRQFLDTLLADLQTPTPVHQPAFSLVLTMRTDFLGEALNHPPLAEALEDAGTKLLGAMSPDELKLAIEEPAKKVGLSFEKGLVEIILKDIAQEPGHLPLLEFALTLLWERRSSRLLTHKAYTSIGGVEGALARYADQEYDDLSSADEKEQARRVFIRMVHPGQGTADTRQKITKEQLGEDNWSLVQKLADARLVVTGRNETAQETVELVHEALIRNWSKLRQWMDQDRTFRAWQERLGSAMKRWQEATENEQGFLIREGPLAEAEDWLSKRKAELSDEEQKFIQQSIELQAKQRAEKEAQRQRELEQQRALAEEQRQRAEEQTQAASNLHRRALIAGGVGVVAIFLAIAAVWFGMRSTKQAAEIAQQNEAAQAEIQFSQTTDPGERLTHLVTLFDLKKDNVAGRLFWQLPPADRIALVKVKDDRLLRIIKETYVTMADVNRTGYADPLLEAMTEGLATLQKTGDEINTLTAELEQWRLARKSAREGAEKAAQTEYETTLGKYDAVLKLNDANPATLYERAGVLAKLEEYERALGDLERVVTLIEADPVFATTGIIVEEGSEFATREQVTTAIKRLIYWVKPELGEVLNRSSESYPNLEQAGLVSAPTLVTDAKGVKMVLVADGPFDMGSSQGQSNERPVHKVTLDAFFIDQYEVTNAYYAEFLNDQGNQEGGETPWLSEDLSQIYQTDSQWQVAGDYANHPIVGVSWYGAKAYCEWRDEKKTRLPTEAEWEKAARGTDGRSYPWGENIACHLAKYGECGDDTTTSIDAHPGGVSPYGAYDMAGNVQEWVNDWYAKDYYNDSLPKNPPGPESGESRILRGGSWDSADPGEARATYRNFNSPNIQRTPTIGFRCVMSAAS